jgi:cytoskeleton protein RodZ
VSAGTPSPDAAPAADGGRLVLRAKAEAWVRVRDKTGSVVFDHVLRPGETWPVPNRGGLLLTVGNAGGTEVLLDGQPSASLGADGAVRHDLPLELDQVRDGKLAPAPAPVAVTPAKPAAPKQP